VSDYKTLYEDEKQMHQDWKQFARELEADLDIAKEALRKIVAEEWTRFDLRYEDGSGDQFVIAKPVDDWRWKKCVAGIWKIENIVRDVGPNHVKYFAEYALNLMNPEPTKAEGGRET